jgi:hypothetical protein
VRECDDQHDFVKGVGDVAVSVRKVRTRQHAPVGAPDLDAQNVDPGQRRMEDGFTRYVVTVQDLGARKVLAAVTGHRKCLPLPGALDGPVQRVDGNDRIVLVHHPGQLQLHQPRGRDLAKGSRSVGEADPEVGEALVLLPCSGCR